jgi:hypothetical protein
MDFNTIIVKPLKNMMNHPKLATLLVSVIIFSIIYTFLEDKHFSGVNAVREQIKEEVIKKEIKSKVKEPEIMDVSEPFLGSNVENYYGLMKEAEIEKKIDEAKEEVEEEVEEEELTPEKIEQSLGQRFFNRAYFSFTTATLLGFGDIIPVTNICKFIVMIQAMITVGLIVF